MQLLSPSDYLPLDSRAPAVFRSTEISIYIYSQSLLVNFSFEVFNSDVLFTVAVAVSLPEP